jgi:hypothetical protein
LIDKHHYSKHFPFDITLTGSLSFEQRKRRVQRKKRLASEHHENRNDGNSTKDVGMDELVSNMSKLRIPKSISFGHAKPSIQRHGYNTRSATKDVNMTQQDDKKRPYSRKKRETMGVDRA